MNLKSLIKKHEPFITRSPHLYFSPGRVNLIGEHIDYLGGHVFPTAIDLGTYAFVSSREDQEFHFLSENFIDQGEIIVHPKDLDYNEADDWVNYCKGMMQAFKIDELEHIHGLNILIYGDLPNGAGLSSSASLEVLMGVVLRDELNVKIEQEGKVKVEEEGKVEPGSVALTDTEKEMRRLVQIAQKVENEYIGVNCGIMDQFAVGMSRRDSALYLNTDTLEFERVPLVLGEYSLVIANTNKRRELSSSKYNERRQECDAALQSLRAQGLKIENLCDMDPEEFVDVAALLHDPIHKARTEHAVYENARSARAVEVLQAGNILEFGELMNGSHDSLRDLFEVSCKELDVLVDAFRKYGAIGARMTGGGFGGCAIALLPSSERDSILEKVGEHYKKDVGYAADFYPVNTHDGTARSHHLLYTHIAELADYAIHEGLSQNEDRDYVINRLLAELKLKEYEEPESNGIVSGELSDIIEPLLDHAYERGCFSPNTVNGRDIFEARLVDILLPRPSELNAIFNDLYKVSPEKATSYFYKFSQKSDYIKHARIAKNISWRSNTPYGIFDITINLSKPEKDPRDIIASGQKQSSTYPKCLLCKENVGYEGHARHPGRSNHRIIPLLLHNEKFYLQYSPYVYYNEHCIVLKDDHVPMAINEKTFHRLLDFVDQFPHYFLGSNADLPIVGGSILSHEHYQGGRHVFAMELAQEVESRELHAHHSSIKLEERSLNEGGKVDREVESRESKVEGNGRIRISKLFWPLSVIRLEAENKDILIQSANILLKLWKGYSDDRVGILAGSGGVFHNTITPAARKVGDVYQLDMVLRNNRCSDEHPLGIFHPHAEHHHIKKENIGLIEAMGLAILPARLEKELAEIKVCLEHNTPLSPDLAIHREWFDQLKERYQYKDPDEFIRKEVTLKFVQCLEDAGVFKQDEEGQQAFDDFITHYLEALKGDM